MYDDFDYAARRLNETLVRKVTGELFYINRCLWEGREISCNGEDLINEVNETLPLSRIDLIPIPLGYVNTPQGMVFTGRKPMRRDWRQGLSRNSMFVKGMDRSRLNLKWLRQPVYNQYPSVNRALENFSLKKSSVAVSRDFGLKREGEIVNLYYRTNHVGRYQDGHLVLNPEKFFLQEHLNKTVVMA